MRGDLVTYLSLPFYRAMLERSGFEDEIAAFDEGMGAGDVEQAKAGISERMLTALSGIGSADEVRAGIERYRDAGRGLALRRRDPAHRLRGDARRRRRAALAPDRSRGAESSATRSR